jgi:polysaccharide pyruvyl transferase WcaK-like protein
MEHKDITRRNWLKQSGLLVSAALCSTSVSAMFRHLLKDKTILLHSGWQTVNIGDIAHTPGLIKVLQDFSPDTQVMLWPKSRLDRGAEAMLRKGFPNLVIVNGALDEQNKPANAALKDAFAKADFMLHGSGPSVVGHLGLQSWRKTTGKPYGLYGVTIQDIDTELQNLLKGASFIYTRETHSLDRLAEKDIQGEHTGFTPDATFAMHLLDEQKAQKFLQEHALQERKFICVIPRLRKTPYFKIYPDSEWNQQQIDEVNALNEEHKEKDHAKAREAMITYVRETGNKVLVCPEMTYQLEIMDELLIDPLPADVKKNVIKRDTYWLPDEASAIYKKALTVVSFECHSPIMAFVNGTPAFYLRQPEDTIKGQMWYDIGVDDWVFEIEETQGKDITKQLMKVHADFEGAQAYLQKAMDFVRQRHQQCMQFADQSFLKT